ncbi:selenium-dependent molybdenum cofactor biosynthesis protein YqeB [Fusobacterium sp. PH5-44]|uniref:selenium-dependent molybdenum cofactor biosynthesis protein YqeB n=1 Tax=unclassified Fusobacterium TaxID=2648384 RepID=UPI003D1AA96C
MKSKDEILKKLVIVRGGGDIATGTIYKLAKCNYPIIILETSKPTAIRRSVAFSEAVYDKISIVEDMKCFLASSFGEVMDFLQEGKLTMLIDSDCQILEKLRPHILIDAILAKKNLGTCKDMANYTIGLGPGFEAGKDVDIVIETMRGHNLGQIIYKGFAKENTGIPGNIGGYTKERVIYATNDGIIKNMKTIGELIEKDQLIAVIYSGNTEAKVFSPIKGILRGIIRDNFKVKKGLKIADIDPREKEQNNSFTISDKARTIAGGVLEGIITYERSKS